jgi:hypothetical protein
MGSIDAVAERLGVASIRCGLQAQGKTSSAGHVGMKVQVRFSTMTNEAHHDALMLLAGAPFGLSVVPAGRAGVIRHAARPVMPANLSRGRDLVAVVDTGGQGGPALCSLLRGQECADLRGLFD